LLAKDTLRIRIYPHMDVNARVGRDALGGDPERRPNQIAILA
jgi:hypothetical protein